MLVNIRNKFLKVINPSFLVVFLFAILTSVIYYNNYINWNVYLAYDEAVYVTLAKRFLAGQFFSAFNPYWNPGFPVFIIPFYFLSGSWEKSLPLISMISAVMIIFLMYFTLKKISIWLAIGASFFATFSQVLPTLTLTNGVTEPLYIVFYWLGLIKSWEALVSRKKKDYILLGIFFGLAYFIRTEALSSFLLILLIISLSYILEYKKFISLKIFSVLPKIRIHNLVAFLSLIFILVSLFYYPITKLNVTRIETLSELRPPFTHLFFTVVFLIVFINSLLFQLQKNSLMKKIKIGVVNISICLLFFLIINLPYITVLSMQLNKITFSGKYSYLISGHPFTPEKDRLTTWAQDIWSVDFPNYDSPYYDSARVLSIYLKGFENTLESYTKLFWYYLNLYGFDNTYKQYEINLAVLGIVLGLLYKKTRQFTLYLIVVWFFTFNWVVVFMAISNRYLAYSFPIVFMAMAGGVWLGIKYLNYVLSKAHLNYKIRFYLLSLLIAFSAYFYIADNNDISNFYTVVRHEKNADQKMIGEFLKSINAKTIMTRTEGIGYYANAQMVYIPAAPPEEIVKHAKGWGVEYIVSRPVESSWDYMRDIVKPNYKNPNLILVKQFGDGTLIWKVELTPWESEHNFRTDQKI